MVVPDIYLYRALSSFLFYFPTDYMDLNLGLSELSQVRYGLNLHHLQKMPFSCILVHQQSIVC